MKIFFAFGRQGVELSFPEGPRYEVVRAHAGKPVEDTAAALDAALDAPIGCAALAELARGKRTAAISVCDITRPAPNAITLPPLLKRLHQGGIEAENITILIATGLHRLATAEEIQTILGPEIAASYRVVNHDAKDHEAHRYLGATRRGTPIYIDERFIAADLHISLGFIEQHLMLGFSGGRKLVAPGIAAQETIKVIHSPCFMREPLAIEGSFDENPLHGELLEIASIAGHHFILDVTLTKEREISGIFSGNPVKAHAAGVEFLRNSSLEYLPERADAVITSAAGYPLDLTFYQTIKGITAAQHVLKLGGKILVVGECGEGIGSPEFTEMMREFKGPRHYLDYIKDRPVAPDQWQLEKLALVAEKHPILFYTPGIRPEELGSFEANCFQSLEDAVHALIRDLPEGARVALIPDGPYTYVRVKPA